MCFILLLEQPKISLAHNRIIPVIDHAVDSLEKIQSTLVALLDSFEVIMAALPVESKPEKKWQIISLFTS